LKSLQSKRRFDPKPQNPRRRKGSSNLTPSVELTSARKAVSLKTLESQKLMKINYPILQRRSSETPTMKSNTSEFKSSGKARTESVVLANVFEALE
jgi:hypothetical protein